MVPAGSVTETSQRSFGGFECDTNVLIKFKVKPKRRNDRRIWKTITGLSAHVCRIPGKRSQ